VSRASERPAVTPELLVTAAARIVDTEGIDALSLSRVAADLGVTQPAMYNHVQGVDDLLRRLALLARRMLLQRLRDAAVGRAQDDAVVALANAWRDFVHQHPGLYAATDRHPLAGFADLEAAVADIISVLQQVVSGYGLVQQEAEHGAWSLRSALHGFVVLESERGYPGPLDLDESFSLLVRLMCGGLREMADQPVPADEAAP
jgi:AcrR family transcriptional regulator